MIHLPPIKSFSTTLVSALGGCPPPTSALEGSTGKRKRRGQQDREIDSSSTESDHVTRRSSFMKINETPFYEWNSTLLLRVERRLRWPTTLTESRSSSSERCTAEYFAIRIVDYFEIKRENKRKLSTHFTLIYDRRHVCHSIIRPWWSPAAAEQPSHTRLSQSGHSAQRLLYRGRWTDCYGNTPSAKHPLDPSFAGWGVMGWISPPWSWSGRDNNFCIGCSYFCAKTSASFTWLQILSVFVQFHMA